MTAPRPDGVKTELGEFLRARRAAVPPAAAGLPEAGRRRVPGLRREEVATLVGLSTDYYVRLEQGRGGRPSEPVLDAISRVLMLDDAQRAHLHHLAHPVRRRRRGARTAPERMSEATRSFLRTLTVPALVLTRSTRVIGWNDLACAVFTDFGSLPEHERNTAWLLFSDDEVAARHRDWDSAARATVGILRMTAGQEPDHPGLSELVGGLSVRSDTFRRLWAEHHVHEKTSGVQLLRHPELGDLDLTYLSWTTPAAPGQMLVTYTPEPGSPSARALDALGSLIATDRPVSASGELHR
ncbi:helix-turn-helix transcriptional regulator [Saccharopolyspora sp. MS10]|uniref:helix-turn-helix transcriptional regulator n=1 Tax=Saccharopolyspora sp. MS10 TaxID=3385973 RepID=UPI0039A20439